MSERVCICFGVSKYSDDGLEEIPGAEHDANRVFDLLVSPDIGENDPNCSKKIVNPTKTEFIHSLSDVLYDKSRETVTIFFAGHGAVVNSSYYLFLSDSNTDRIASTSVSLSEIFQIIGDAKPAHTNIVIDACNAAGMVNDIGTLLKPSEIGPSASSSVSILVTCAADEFAGEALAADPTQGGFGTTEFIRCLEGQIDHKVKRAHLSLDDIAQAMSLEGVGQTSSSWSFNIKGAPKFCKNSFADKDEDKSAFAVPTFETLASAEIEMHNREGLWSEFLKISDDLSPRRLQRRLEAAMDDLESAPQKANFLVGLLGSFKTKASQANDTFLYIQIASIFLISASQLASDETSENLKSYLRAELDEALSIELGSLSNCLSEEFYLVRDGGGYSEFFTLPIRISKIAAWSLTWILFADADAQKVKNRVRLTRRILDQLTASYLTSFVLMSEEQAPYLLIISAMSKRYGLGDWAEQYLGCLYSDYFYSGGRVAKTNIDSTEVFSFLRYRTIEENVENLKFIAKPSEVLMTLLAHFVAYGFSEVIRYDFKNLDGAHVSTFVPESYEYFGAERIRSGENVGFHIGFDLFTITEFEAFINNHVIDKASKSPPDQKMMKDATVSALIYPDRVPWFLYSGQRSPALSTN